VLAIIRVAMKRFTLAQIIYSKRQACIIYQSGNEAVAQDRRAMGARSHGGSVALVNTR
jgi:hypothetical protein